MADYIIIARSGSVEDSIERMIRYTPLSHQTGQFATVHKATKAVIPLTFMTKSGGPFRPLKKKK